MFPKEASSWLSSGSSPPRCILHVKHFKSFFFVFQKRLSSIKGTFSCSHANLLSFKSAYWYYCMGKGRSPLIFGAYTLGATSQSSNQGRAWRPLEHAFPHAKLNYYLFKTPRIFTLLIFGVLKVHSHLVLGTLV